MLFPRKSLSRSVLLLLFMSRRGVCYRLRLDVSQRLEVPCPVACPEERTGGRCSRLLQAQWQSRRKMYPTRRGGLQSCSTREAALWHFHKDLLPAPWRGGCLRLQISASGEQWLRLQPGGAAWRPPLSVPRSQVLSPPWGHLCRARLNARCQRPAPALPEGNAGWGHLAESWLQERAAAGGSERALRTSPQLFTPGEHSRCPLAL